MSPPPSRLLLKLSGEALKGQEGVFSPDALAHIAEELASLVDVQLAIVVGGGNIMRGARVSWPDRVEADTLGMLATVMNGLALRTFLEARRREVVVQSAIPTGLTPAVSIRDARKALNRGAIVLFVGGTGSAYVTTDTAAALRAVAVDADLLAKGSNVRGVFAADPDHGRAPDLIDSLSYDQFIGARYGVMDLIAVEICREARVPIEVFDLAAPEALARIASGERVGTRIG